MTDKLFEQPAIAPYPIPPRLARMWRFYGRDERHTCGECKLLRQFRRNHNHRYFKCELNGITHSTASDWRKFWTACGNFKPKTDEQGE